MELAPFGLKTPYQKICSKSVSSYLNRSVVEHTDGVTGKSLHNSIGRTDGGRKVLNLKATDKPDQDKVNPAHLQTLIKSKTQTDNPDQESTSC
ncbi:hypothetical protein Bpfe_005379 [Biomphalaria pfeifferi]|uniref:Uncharacterized protein n=1 Tax=Biomphalaria pfeifferi TaxID=112525 RepID=A0AAD8C303_BIOPF|nr:hypothetical protein Bpfe_005379 [Biomphalaria pfeifferi]